MGAFRGEAVYGENQAHWILANQAFPEMDARAQAQCVQLLGNVALRGEVNIEPVETDTNDSTLLAAIQMGALGDVDSRRTVRVNVATGVAERLFKAGNETSVQLQIAGSRLKQNGRFLTDIQRNTFAYTRLNPEMTYRSTSELKNVFLFQELLSSGMLATHDAVVWEPCPEDATTKQDYKFFTNTDTCSLQLLRAEGNTATLQTALVAGKKSPDAPRHDMQAIRTVAAENGIELMVHHASDMISYVMLVPKRTIPNGVCDIVAQYDKAAGGTFYGEAKPVQNYQAYAETCRTRNESFDDIVEAVTTQLMREAHAFATPMDAIERLDYLSERYCVDRAVKDRTIYAAVFGEVSAAYIEEARMHLQNGDHEGAEAAIIKAKATADSGSCPLFSKTEEQSDSDSGVAGSHEKQSGKKWMNCPHCRAKVYDDPCAKVLACWDCKAMVVNGRTISTGNGGSRRRQEEARQQQLKRREEAMARQVDAAYNEHDIHSFEQEQQKAVARGGVALAAVQ